MNLRRVPSSIAIFLSLVTACSTVATPASEAPSQPSFIVILADDLGYGDIGCYGSKGVTGVPAAFWVKLGKLLELS